MLQASLRYNADRTYLHFFVIMALPLSGMERQALAGLAVSIVVMAMLHEVVQLREIGEAMHGQFLEGTQDYYSVLGLKDTATQQEIETAYKRATSQFHSRNRNEDERRRRAKIVTAHETLGNVEYRKRYDTRKRLLGLIYNALTAGCVAVPLIGLIFVNMQVMKYINPGNLGTDLQSFEGRLTSAFKRIETSVEVTLQRASSDEKLGMELVPSKSGSPGLQVKSITDGGMVHTHNENTMSSHPEANDYSPVGTKCTWWTSGELHVGDIITSVNGSRRPVEMFEQLGSASQLQLTVGRPLCGVMPWVVEVELTRNSSTERWGCELTQPSDNSDTFEVKTGNFAGAMARWNEANPALRVRPGDRIVAVDRKLKVKKMSTAMKDQTALASTWLIVRGTMPVQEAPLVEVLCGPFVKRKPGDLLGIRIGLALEKPVRGTVLEAGSSTNTVVKEVRAGYLVDQWNKHARGQEVAEGYTVLSVNGRTDPKEFAQELSKPSVLLRVRPPRNIRANLLPAPPEPAMPSNSGSASAADSAAVASAAAGARAEAAARAAEASRGAPLVPLVLEEPPTLAVRLLGNATPSWLRPSSFEDRLRSSLARLRCEFEVELTRTSNDKVGLQLDPARDDVGGLMVKEVASDGLIGRHNACQSADGRKPVVQAGDHLVAVNDNTVVPLMVKVIRNEAIERLSVRFSRKAAEAAPGVWEAEVERFGGEGWGIELREQANTTNGAQGSGALLIEKVHPGLAIDRWNKSFRDGEQKSGWEVAPGDLIVAAAPKVGVKHTLSKLKASTRVRLTLLRWHAGPAPEAPLAPHLAGYTFEVVLERSSSTDRLGVSLDPCIRDPTRTAVAKVLPGGIVDRYNTAATTTPDHDVRVGDEVESVNGEADPSRFAVLCKNDRIVIRLTRRPKADAPPVAATEAAPAQAAAATAANAVAESVTPVQAPAAPAQPTEIPAPAAVIAPEATPAPAPVSAPSTAAAAPLASRSLEAVPASAPSSVAASASPTIPEAPVMPSVAASPTAAPSPVPSSPHPANPEASRENMLLKAELAQLRAQMASRSATEERDRLLLECERLKADNAVMRTEMERLERRSTREKASLEEALAQADELRAEVSRLQAQEQSLQQALQERPERVIASARPHLEEQQLVSEVQQRSLEEGALRLQDLCVSLENILSADVP